MTRIMLIAIILCLSLSLSAVEKVWIGIDYTHKGSKGSYLYGEIDKSVWDKLKGGTYDGNTIYLTKTCWVDEDKQVHIKKSESKFYQDDLILFTRDITQFYSLKGDPHKILKQIQESK